jgi:hypothetical protein
MDARSGTFSACALLPCWLRPSWHSATMPVGRWVMRTAEVGLVDVLAARAVLAGVNAQVRRVDLDGLGFVGSGSTATVRTLVWNAAYVSVAGTRCAVAA